MQTRSAHRNSVHSTAALGPANPAHDDSVLSTSSDQDEQNVGQHESGLAPEVSRYTWTTDNYEASLHGPSEWSSHPYEAQENDLDVLLAPNLSNYGILGDSQSSSLTYESPSRGFARVYPERSAAARLAPYLYDEDENDQSPFVAEPDTGRHTGPEVGFAAQPESYPLRRRRVGDKGERFLKEFTAAKTTLRFRSIQAARRQVQARIPLGIPRDDVDEVEAQHQFYIKRMLMAFDEDELRDPPEDRSRSEEELRYFRNWQTDQHNAVLAKVKDKVDTPSFVEERCWDVYLAVIDMHRRGTPLGLGDKAKTLECACSVRIGTIIDAMRGFTIVRLDILRRDRVEQLVHNPVKFVERKLANVWVNQKKQVKGKTTASKSRKRRRTVDAVQDDADGSYA